MAFCRKCGAELRPGATFCEKCGASVDSGSQSFDSYSPQPATYQGTTPRSSFNPADRQMLRILSVVFSIALMVFLIGLGGRIYLGRVVDESYKNSSQKPSSTERSFIIKYAAAIIRGDARAALNAQLDYAKSQNPSIDYKITDEEVESFKHSMNSERINEQGRDEYGFRWILLELATFYSPLMWGGGIAALILLALWIVKGGRPGNLSETASPAACICLLGLICLIVYLVMSPDFSKSNVI